MSKVNNNMSYWQAETDGQPLIESTIGAFLDRRVAEFPMKEALVYSAYSESGIMPDLRWTYQQYHALINAVARGLIALGLEKGDHIALWAINLPEWPILYLAAIKAGLVLVTINPALRAAEVEYILEQGDVRALFFMAQLRDHDCLATMRSLITPGASNGDVHSERLPVLRYLGLMGSPPSGSLEQEQWRPILFQELVSAGAQVSDQALAERQASVTPSDPALIMYTSGTTGFPKGAILTHRILLNQATAVPQPFGGEQDNRICSLVPFFHIFGNIDILAALWTGGTLYPLVAFDPLKVMQVISREHCNSTGGVPTMLLAILQHPEFSRYDLSSLKLVRCAGAPVPVTLMEQVKERIGADIGIGLGMTECGGPITSVQLNDPPELKATTVGTPVRHVEVKIIDPATSKIVACGEPGELCCRGYLVMKGYYKMPERTAETIDAESWLHTGDLTTMNTEGYIKIVGRLKDTIIRGGENIFPVEIEEFLVRHPKVAAAQVLGVPDAYFGEAVLAVVQPRQGEQLNEEELRSFCTGQISHQKIPRYFQFVEGYPLTANGKVRKHILRERAIKALGILDIP